ncbi:MAG: hypothetical protein RL685_7842 [Pseudomonadota bacterium]|jgi:hypothetical protein
MLLSGTSSFGVARLARLLLELGSELELALRSEIAIARLSVDSVQIEHVGTSRERARLPLATPQPGIPALQPALREMGTLIEQLLGRSLCVEDALPPARAAAAPRRADQPLLHAWRCTLAVIARRCASAGAYRSAAELVSDLARLSHVSERIVARRRRPPLVYVHYPKPAKPLTPLPKVMLRCA